MLLLCFTAAARCGRLACRRRAGAIDAWLGKCSLDAAIRSINAKRFLDLHCPGGYVLWRGHRCTARPVEGGAELGRVPPDDCKDLRAEISTRPAFRGSKYPEDHVRTVAQLRHVRSESEPDGAHLLRYSPLRCAPLCSCRSGAPSSLRSTSCARCILFWLILANKLPCFAQVKA